MSRSFRDRSPIRIAIVTLIVMSLMLVAAFLSKPALTHQFSITAEFSDAAGVSKGAPVRVAGVQVGQVKSVRADRNNGRVVVKLGINNGVQLGPNTHAEVALATLLGAKYVRLTGRVTRPFLAAGAVIPNDRTVTPYDIFELTKVATRRIEETDNEKLNTLIKQLAAVTDGKAESFKQLVEGIAKLSTAIASRDTELDDLLTRADTISTTLAVKDQTLANLLDQSDGILKVLAARHDVLAQGVHDASSAFGQLAGVIHTHKTELDSILDILHPTIDILDKHQADLDRSLSWIGEGAYGLALAPSHGPWADVYIRALGPDVLGLVGSLTGQAP